MLTICSQSWGPSFNFSVWYVGLSGDDDATLGKDIKLVDTFLINLLNIKYKTCIHFFSYIFQNKM